MKIFGRKKFLLHGRADELTDEWTESQSNKIRGHVSRDQAVESGWDHEQNIHDFFFIIIRKNTFLQQ